MAKKACIDMSPCSLIRSSCLVLLATKPQDDEVVEGAQEHAHDEAAWEPLCHRHRARHRVQEGA
eukprot:1381477-Pleurochrysis_carterae.AAC.4